MGSGDRVKYGFTRGIGIGVHVDSFPFELTISVTFLLWYISVGFGKAYDE